MMGIDFRVPIEENKRPPIEVLLGGHKNHHQYCLDLRGKAQSVTVRNLALRPLYFVMNREANVYFHHLTNGAAVEYHGDICYGVCPNSDAGATPWVHYLVSTKFSVHMSGYSPTVYLYQEGLVECNTTDKELARLLYSLAGLRKEYAYADYYMYRLDHYLKEKMDNAYRDVHFELEMYFTRNIPMKGSCIRAIDALQSFANKLDEFNQKEE